MNDFTKGHNGRGGKIYTVHVTHYPLIDHGRHIFRHGLNRFNSIILVIFHLVEGGHINAADFYNLLQKGLASPRLTSTLPLLIGRHYLYHHLFAFTNDGKIKEVSQWLRIIDAGPTHDY